MTAPIVPHEMPGRRFGDLGWYEIAGDRRSPLHAAYWLLVGVQITDPGRYAPHEWHRSGPVRPTEPQTPAPASAHLTARNPY